MRKAGAVQPLANRAHHAVHHAAGRHHVGTGPRVAEGLTGDQLQRGVVVDVRASGALVHHAAMPVIGVFAKADVGDQEQVRRRFLGCAQRLLHDPLIAGRIAAVSVLGVGNAEQDHAPQAQFGRFLDFAIQLIGRKLIVPGHRADGRPHVLAGPHEQGQDEVAGRQPRLLH